MSLLTVIQTATDLLALTRPTAAATSSDPNVRQLIALANVDGQDVASRYAWQELIQEATFTTVAAESQGDIGTIAPGFLFVINDTIWNRSQNVLMNHLSPQRWQRLKAQTISGPYGRFRIRGSELLLIPAPAAGLTVAFEFATKNWVLADDSTTNNVFTADSDVSLLSEETLVAGIRWRFLRAKGLDYSEEYATYERLIADAQGRNGGRSTLYTDGPSFPMGVGTPEGSWNL